MNGFSVVCCVYCYMGREDRFASQLKGVAVVVPCKIRREKVKGKWIDKKVKLVPGYAFVYADSVMQVQQAIKGFKVKILCYSDQTLVLRGSDLEFARWVWSNSGLIGVSAAVHENDKVKIISGPLKETEGMIVRLDRRHQLAKVELAIGLSIWLSYDWLDKIEPQK